MENQKLIRLREKLERDFIISELDPGNFDKEKEFIRSFLIFYYNSLGDEK